jgi:alpha-ketoglutarate-dependent taurine dioxygenase
MTTIAAPPDVRKMNGRIGAEIIGFDVSRRLDDDAVAFITTSLHRYKALLFRNTGLGNTGLDDESQRRFMDALGKITKAHPTVPGLALDDQVLPVDSETGHRANRWHTDVTFVLNPPAASALRSVVVPPYGGETLVANAAAAYSDLPRSLREFAETLWAVHSNDLDYAHSSSRPDEADEADERESERRRMFVSTKFRTVHPVVRVHPATGERTLFIGGFAKELVGYSQSDSREILQRLQSHVTRPENIVTVGWEPEQLLLYDNQATQHYGVDNYDGLPRRLHRVTIAGEVPVGVNGERSRSLEGNASSYSP